MDPAQDPTDPAYAKNLFESLVRGTKMSNAVPSTEKHDYASSFPQYSAAMGNIGNRLNGLIGGLVDQHSTLLPQPGGHQQPPMNGAGGVDEVSSRFENVVDLSERLLESVDADLDRARGISHAVEMGPPPATPASGGAMRSAGSGVLGGQAGGPAVAGSPMTQQVRP